MNNPQLDQAREWADDSSYQGDALSVAAAHVIQSLPDQWVDAEKVREVISKVLANTIPGTVGRQVAEDHAALIGELIPAPSPPTLADMTPEEREWCQWMQAISDPDSGYTDGPVVIVQVDDNLATLMWGDGSFDTRYHQHITPLPDLPRLEWPAQEPRNPETPPAEMVNNPSSDTPRNSEEIVKAIRYEKELCLSNQDFSRAMLWRNMERAAGQGEWKDLLNSIRDLKLPKLERPGTEPAETESAVDDLAHAIRLTVEYTGNDLLPAIPGWSWFDALMKHRPDLAQPFIDKPITSPEPTLPRPEDVPAGEPWIVKHDGHKWVGTRESRDGANWPWALARLDGIKITSSKDLDITLVSRLVPEDKP